MHKTTIVILALFAFNTLHSQDSISYQQEKALFLSLDGYRFTNLGFRYHLTSSLSFDAYVALNLDTQTPQQPGQYWRTTDRAFVFGLLSRFVAYRLDDASFYLTIGPQI